MKNAHSEKGLNVKDWVQRMKCMYECKDHLFKIPFLIINRINYYS